MAFETRITVPTQDLPALTQALARAGCVILDRGERTTTDDGIDAEATCHVLFPQEEIPAESTVDVRA